MTDYNKAITAIITNILTLVAAFGLNVEWASPTLVTTIGMVFNSLLVFLIPNIKNIKKT